MGTCQSVGTKLSNFLPSRLQLKMRAVINGMNARSWQNIVKLVEKQDLPESVKLLLWVRLLQPDQS